MEIDFMKLLFEFIGGLGIFLLGIKYLGEGLQNSAGERLREILDRFTSNPLLGVLAGMLVTMLIQSSSGTTVLTVGLVNAGFMTLRQAIGVIMGANIGTTITAFIIGLDIGDFALPIIAVGSFLIFFFKHQRITSIGQAIFGFGALFFGINLMTSGMAPLSNLASFQELAINMSSTPVLGVVIGTFFTLIVQSSSATIGILQGLFSEGAIDLHAALPVLFGDNIGTTMTAVLAAIGTSVAAKRAALTHVIFNLLGTVIFLIFLDFFTTYVAYLQASFNLNPQMTIAFAHGSFNTFNTFIQLPLIGVLAWIVTKLIPGEAIIVDYEAKHLDPIFIQRSPTVALSQAKSEVIRMGDIACKGLDETYLFLTTKQPHHATTAMKIEGALNHLDKEITKYLIDISSKTMSEVESAEHTSLMDTIRDIERIGDHFENIIETIEYQVTNKVQLPEEALEDINNMFDLALLNVRQSIYALNHIDKEEALTVLQRENLINQMEQKFRKKHIIRMNEGISDATAGMIFVDIVNDLERIADHAVNIAEEVLRK
ncbi:Na/Pi cotransporter family protein [Ornithinibacillus sp. 4-3]|uniref:Na/Pi cotransporter family protein n=1 Tax=Ornithinibacillus sp. 4-3 TaxID=3231488 RepID=A0AB39HNH6_9BACI